MAGSVSLSLLQRFNWLAHRMGFGQEQTDDIRDAALLHNVGKLETWGADKLERYLHEGAVVKR
jgi:response regulator RpfG family c-di-GMP phosphodiesterase